MNEFELNVTLNNKGVIKGLKNQDKAVKKTISVGQMMRKRFVKIAKGIGGSFKRILKSVVSLKGAIIGLVGAGGIGLLVKGTLDAIDRIGKLSTITGISTETLGTLSLAAELAGTDLESVAQASLKLGKNLNEFLVRGTGEAARAFEQLGLGVEDFTGIGNDIEGQLTVIAERFQGMTDGATKAALAQEIFGRAGAKLIPLLNQGAAGIERLKEEAESMGLTLSRETVQGVEDANDAMTRLGKRVSGTFQNIIAANAPAIEDLANTLSDSLRDFIDSNGGPEAVGLAAARSLINIGAEIALFFDSAINSAKLFANASIRVLATIPGSGVVIQDEATKTAKELEKLIEIQESQIQRLNNEREDLSVFQLFDISALNSELNITEQRLEAFKAQQDATTISLFNTDSVGDNVKKIEMARTAALDAINNASQATPSNRLQPSAAAAETGTPFDDTALNKLKQSLLSEEEVIRQSFQKKSVILFEALEADAITQGEFTATQIQLVTQRNEKLTALTAGQVALEQQQDQERFLRKQVALENEIIGLSVEEEALLVSYQRRAMIITEAEMAGEISLLEARNRQLEAAQSFEDQRTEILNGGLSERATFEANTLKGQAKTFSGFLLSSIGAASKSSRALFAINKAAGIVNASINTSEAYTRALASFPPPFGAIAAGVVLASGVAQINNIRSQSFGGGSAPSASGGGGGTRSTGTGQDVNALTQFDNVLADEQQQTISTTINIVDPSGSVINTIQNDIANNGLILIDPASQNAQAIATVSTQGNL